MMVSSIEYEANSFQLIGTILLHEDSEEVALFPSLNARTTVSRRNM
jgi:hypothetical protein